MPVVDDEDVVIDFVSVKRVVGYLVDFFPRTVYNLPPDPAAMATTPEGS